MLVRNVRHAVDGGHTEQEGPDKGRGEVTASCRGGQGQFFKVRYLKPYNRLGEHVLQKRVLGK
jgi:hypothetical protein